MTILEYNSNTDKWWEDRQKSPITPQFANNYCYDNPKHGIDINEIPDSIRYVKIKGNVCTNKRSDLR